MTTNQMVNDLFQAMFLDMDATDEQLELITKLQRSFETEEEKAIRVSKFRASVTQAVNSASKFN